MNTTNLVDSAPVREFFGYEEKSRVSFWKFIRTKGVPHIRLGPRKIMFDPVALNGWIKKRDTSPTPRYFTFGDAANHALPTSGSAGLR